MLPGDTQVALCSPSAHWSVDGSARLRNRPGTPGESYECQAFLHDPTRLGGIWGAISKIMEPSPTQNGPKLAHRAPNWPIITSSAGKNTYASIQRFKKLAVAVQGVNMMDLSFRCLMIFT